MILLISKNDLKQSLVKTEDQQWRSLEHFLESSHRDFEFDDMKSVVRIEVSDEMDALRLGKAAGLESGVLESEDGNRKNLLFITPKKPGRPRNVITDKATGKGMTINQYKKQLKSETLPKAEVVKRGILTKTELEKAIATGKLRVVQIGNSQRISQEALRSYLDS